MNIADNKKQTNISEYIIHMYQTEDLIRVFGFDMDNICEYVIKHFPVSDEDKEKLREWYADIMQRMESEGIKEKGHLEEIQTYVTTLSELSEELKKSDAEYCEIYKTAKPHIDEGLEFAKGAVEGEVQICLNGIYGLLIARMNGREVPEELMEGINAFGSLLSYLSYKHKQQN